MIILKVYSLIYSCTMSVYVRAFLTFNHCPWYGHMGYLKFVKSYNLYHRWQNERVYGHMGYCNRNLHLYGKRWGVEILLEKRDPSMCFAFARLMNDSVTSCCLTFYLFPYFLSTPFFFLCLELFKRLISEALQKMKGKIPEIAGSHVSSRVLQVFFFLIFFLYAINFLFIQPP